MTVKKSMSGASFHLVFMVVVLLLYIGSCAYIARQYDGSPGSVSVYDPERAAPTLSMALMIMTMSVSSLIMTFILPGLPLARVIKAGKSTILDTLLLSFLLTIGFSFVCGIVLKGIMALTMDRRLVVGMCLTLWAIGFAIMAVKEITQGTHAEPVNEVVSRCGAERADKTDANSGRELIFFLCFVLVLSLIVCRKIFVEPFSGDGAESYYFSASLLQHMLPYWDMENGSFGFYSGFMITFYPNSHLIALLGPIEAAVRLPYFVYLFFVLAVFNDVLRRFSALGAVVRVVLLAVTAGYSVLVNLSCSTYSFIVDLAEPLTTDMAFLFLLSSGLLYSLRGRWLTAVAFYWCMTVCLVSGRGLSLIVLTIMLLFLPCRVRILKSLIVMVSLVLVYSYVAPLLGGFSSELVSPQSLIVSQLLGGDISHVGSNLGTLVKTTGILPLVLPLFGFWFLFRRRGEVPDWSRVTAVLFSISLCYAVILINSPKMHIHYLLPLQFLFPVAAFIGLEAFRSIRLRRFILGIHLILTVVLFILAFPREYPLDHGPRLLGKMTRFAIQDEETAVECSSLFHTIADAGGNWFPASPWKAIREHRYYIGRHALLYYSQRYGAGNPSPVLFFTEGGDTVCGNGKEIARNDRCLLCVSRRKRLLELSQKPNPLIVPGPLFQNMQFGR